MAMKMIYVACYTALGRLPLKCIRFTGLVRIDSICCKATGEMGTGVQVGGRGICKGREQIGNMALESC